MNIANDSKGNILECVNPECVNPLIPGAIGRGTDMLFRLSMDGSPESYGVNRYDHDKLDVSAM
jgi:hypothetical protein